jgi:hypothetical protein
LSANLNASNISLYDVASLSNVPSLSTAVLNEVISLSNLSGLIAILPPSLSEIIELERLHNQDFFDKIRIVKEYMFLDEFIDAVREEEYGLQKIIEAYDKRIMNQS